MPSSPEIPPLRTKPSIMRSMSSSDLNNLEALRTQRSGVLVDGVSNVTHYNKAESEKERLLRREGDGGRAQEVGRRAAGGSEYEKRCRAV